MPFEKGKSGNPTEKPTEAKNKNTVQLKDTINNFLSDNFELTIQDFDQLPPKPSGKDIYMMLQKNATLKTRDEAKKRFFELLLSRPNNGLEMIFGTSFLSVHDEIIVKQSDSVQSERIFNTVLKSQFSYFKLNSKK